MRNMFLIGLLTLGMTVTAQAHAYRISAADQAKLEELDEYYPDQDGGQWMRCHKGRCYIMQTGVELKSFIAKEGYYLVWPNPQVTLVEDSE